MTPLTPKFDLSSAIAKHSENALLFEHVGQLDMKVQTEASTRALSFSQSFDQANKLGRNERTSSAAEERTNQPARERVEREEREPDVDRKEHETESASADTARESDTSSDENEVKKGGEETSENQSESSPEDDAPDESVASDEITVGVDDEGVSAALSLSMQNPKELNNVKAVEQVVDQEISEDADDESPLVLQTKTNKNVNTEVGLDIDLDNNAADELGLLKSQLKDISASSKMDNTDKSLKDALSKLNINSTEKVVNGESAQKSSGGDSQKTNGDKIDPLSAMINIAAAKGQKRTSETREGGPSLQISSAKATGGAIANPANPAVKPVTDTGKITVPMTVKVGQPQWAGQIAERTAWLASQKISSADIQLDPPELGPIAVKVNIQNDQATVSFVSANQSVREALDQSQMRLKEMFESEGMDLVDVDVSDQSQEQADNEEQGSAQGTLSQDGVSDDSDMQGSEMSLEVSSGIDHFV